jgi:hypothetical protein
MALAPHSTRYMSRSENSVGVNHAVVDQWLSYAVKLALPSGELDLRVLVDVACSLGHELGEDDGRIPAPTQLFSCAALRSLRLGPSRLDYLSLPNAIHLLSLDTLLLTRVAGAMQQHLHRLALWCCDDLVVVAVDDTTELRARPAFLTFDDRPWCSCCAP